MAVGVQQVEEGHTLLAAEALALAGVHIAEDILQSVGMDCIPAVAGGPGLLAE